VKGIEINEQLVNPETGDSLGDFRDKPGEGRAGKMPAEVKTLEWMVRNGIAKDYNEAWDKKNVATVNPAKFVTNYVNQELEAQESGGIYPGSEGYKTTEQMRADAMEALQIVRGKKPVSSGEPKGLKITGADSQVLPADGRPVKQQDGSYSGRVDRSGNARPEAPAAGTVMDGYKFMGGNPADKTNWKRVTQ